MANYSNLLATIAANVYTNGNNEVTAAMVKAALDAVVAALAAGFLPKGVATPATDPQSPDEKVQYLATTPGTYTNFGGIVLRRGRHHQGKRDQLEQGGARYCKCSRGRHHKRRCKPARQRYL